MMNIKMKDIGKVLRKTILQMLLGFIIIIGAVLTITIPPFGLMYLLMYLGFVSEEILASWSSLVVGVWFIILFAFIALFTSNWIIRDY